MQIAHFWGEETRGEERSVRGAHVFSLALYASSEISYFVTRETSSNHPPAEACASNACDQSVLLKRPFELAGDQEMEEKSRFRTTST